jgi:hypothetical protein
MMTHASYPPIYNPLFSPYKCHCSPQYIFFHKTQWGGVNEGWMLHQEAWSAKGVANRGGCDKPQNNNGWREPELELWTCPVMEALCSGATPSTLADRWQGEGKSGRNSQGAARVEYLAPTWQRLFTNFAAHSSFRKIKFLLKIVNGQSEINFTD